MEYLIVCRVLLCAACLFNVIYSMRQLHKFKMPLYFKCAFYAAVSQLFCSILYITILITDVSSNHIFNLADFGVIAANLFIVVANKKLIPKEYEEQFDTAPNFWGIAAVIVVGAMLVASIVIKPSAENIISNVLNMIPLAICLYYCIKVITNKYNNMFAQGVRVFCILYMVQLIFTAFMQLATSIGNACLLDITVFCAMVVYPLTLGTDMLFLKKGLEPWEI